MAIEDKDKEIYLEGFRSTTQEHPRVSKEDLGKLAEAQTEPTQMRGFHGSLPAMSRPEGIKSYLKVLQGPNKGHDYELTDTFNTIGRGDDNNVIIKDPFISTRHVAIYFSQANEWRITDLGSRNGTLLNGSKVKEFVIRSGDKILLGDYLLQFMLEPI
jgi:hypothetical protein